ncbi:hypothetical protein ABIC08_009395 [Bradyrhizobium sp. RT9b]
MFICCWTRRECDKASSSAGASAVRNASATAAAHRIKEGRARVFHQMPAVGDLDGVWERLGCCLAISTTAISRHNVDARVLRQPRLNGRRFPVEQQGNDPPTLQIAHDGPVPTVSPERPVIDTHNKQWISRHRRPPADHPQQGIVADRQHEPLGEACGRPAAERQPQVMDDVFEPCRSTPSKRNDVFSEPLREDLPAAMRHLACEASREQSETHLCARGWQIGNAPDVAAMDAARRCRAQRALSLRSFRPNSQNKRIH